METSIDVCQQLRLHSYFSPREQAVFLGSVSCSGRLPTVRVGDGNPDLQPVGQKCRRPWGMCLKWGQSWGLALNLWGWLLTPSPWCHNSAVLSDIRFVSESWRHGGNPPMHLMSEVMWAKVAHARILLMNPWNLCSRLNSWECANVCLVLNLC